MPVLGVRPTLTQYDLTVTDYTRKDLFPMKSRVLRFQVAMRSLWEDSN